MEIRTEPRRLLGVVGIVLAGILSAGCGSGNGSESASQPDPTSTVSAAAEVAPTDTPTAEGEPTAAGDTTFRIVPDGTEARFYIDEVLLGEDKTVIGVTSLVTGEMSVSPNDPSSAQIGEIRIDARDLTTDNSRRNTAIRRYVLQSARDEYQYITFQPTAIDELPASVAIGEPFEFSVIGDLTIRDVTRPETFALTVTANSERELAGLATTTVLRGDYGLTIPNVPAVAGVEEEVRLELEFRAVAD